MWRPLCVVAAAACLATASAKKAEGDISQEQAKCMLEGKKIAMIGARRRGDSF